MSPITIAQNNEYENIEVEEKNGVKILKLTEDQYISVANYISELEATVKRKEKQLEKAKEEIEKAYAEKDNSIDLTQFGDELKGAALATIIILIAGNLQ
ncbi:MAG: hypothetical protein ACQEQF_11025 [Bacillota bacterium]